MTNIIIQLDNLKTKSLANMREHWSAKSRRTRIEREMAKLAVLARRDDIKPTCIITLTRVAPRKLDDDNLRGALKAVRDGVASALRVDDATPLIAWRYRQEQKSKTYAVRIKMEAA